MIVSEPETAAATPTARPGLWEYAISELRHNRTHSMILSGSIILLLGSTLVSVVNFAYNMIAARLLGPTDFGHASVAVTLLMLASAITLAFQLVCAKFVARNHSIAGKYSVIRDLGRQAWLVSSVVAVGLTLFSGALTRYLNLPARSIVLLLALGIWFYIPLGVRRGAMQGTCAFGSLASNFLIETGVKFAGAIIFIELLLHTSVAQTVLGAVAGMALSVLVAYFVPRPALLSRPAEAEPLPGRCIPASFQEGMQAIVFFVGQVLITNTDMILVKHFFAPREAGLYAAVALAGRVLYFAAWSVVSAMFPVTAGAHKRDDRLSILFIPLAAVLLISAGFVAFTTVFPHLIMRTLFGAAFYSPVEGLLSLYAASTGMYALSVVLIAYEMSRRIANTAWLQLLFSGLIVSGIYFFHGDLKQVVTVQVVLMSLMLVAVSLPFLRTPFQRAAQLLERRAA